MRTPRSTVGSYSKVSWGVRFSLSSRASRDWRTPCAASSAEQARAPLAAGAEHADVDGRVAQVGSRVDAGHRDEADPRILQLGKRLREHLPHRLVHPAHALAHGPYSSAWCMSAPPGDDLPDSRLGPTSATPPPRVGSPSLRPRRRRYRGRSVTDACRLDLEASDIRDASFAPATATATGSTSADHVEHERPRLRLRRRSRTPRAGSSRRLAPPLRRARGSRPAARPRRPPPRACARQTTPTAWSTGSSCDARARRRAPSPRQRPPCAPSTRTNPPAGAGTARTTGADGSERGSGSPPCARTHRSYAASAEPSSSACSARRRAFASSTPRSESASSCAAASTTSSRKSGGPPPASVSHASRTSSALPTARPSGCSMSGEHADDVHPGPLTQRTHRLGELARVLDRPHERALAHLDVEDERARAAGDLLRHDARGDERDLVDRRRHVAQRVELLVGRDEIGALARRRRARSSRTCVDELVGGQLDAESGNRLELVERPACVAEPPAAHLPERHAARRDRPARRRS